MDKVSIIVPVYNVEKYIRECIDSIIQQTYKNIEIILVDDGSTDNSGKICDEYAEKDNRIEVIHKENGGISDARNCGLDIVKGKYITFVDSDDYVDITYIEKLYNAIKENNVLISQCNILKVNDNKNPLETLGYFNSEIKSGKNMIYDIYIKHDNPNVVVWNKMYDINLFKNIRFPIGRIHEDAYVTYKIYYSVDRVAIINENLYFYRQREGSITNTNFSIKNYDEIVGREERVNFFIENNENELYALALKDYMGMLKLCYLQTRKNIENSANMQKELIRKYKKNYKNVIKNKDISKLDKIKTTLFYISPTIYFKIKELRNKGLEK